MRNVIIAGTGMTPFRKSLESSVAEMACAATTDALVDAGVDAQGVGMVFYANAMSGLMDGQEMIRGQAALRRTGLLGVPIVNVENACASSSTAAHLAWMAVASGQVDVALAVGAEKLTHEDKARALKGLGSAVNLERVAELEAELYGPLGELKPSGDRSFFMDIYADMAERYMRRSGATPRDFAEVVVKNRRHAVFNPRAQYRDLVTAEQVLASRSISGALTLLMCSPVGDGAAALLFCSDEVARRLSVRRVRVGASVLVSGYEVETSETAVQRASRRAYELAGVGPEDLDVVEVHDAAAPAELMMYEELGLCAQGDGPALLASGATSLGGRIPVNTGGGLISRGHPVGATGCAQLVELVEQLRGSAGDRQVDGARVALAENAGGYLHPDPAAVCVSILVAD